MKTRTDIKKLLLLAAVFAFMLTYTPVMGGVRDSQAPKEKKDTTSVDSLILALPSITDSFGMFKDLGWSAEMVMLKVDDVYLRIMDNLDQRIISMEKELETRRDQKNVRVKQGDKQAAAEFKDFEKQTKETIKGVKKLRNKVTNDYISIIKKVENDYDKDLK